MDWVLCIVATQAMICFKEYLAMKLLIQEVMMIVQGEEIDGYQNKFELSATSVKLGRIDAFG